MSTGGIEWVCTDGETDMGAIQQVEERLKIKFPDDYIVCARINHGGHPKQEVYDFEGRKEAVFNRLLCFREGQVDYIPAVYGYVHDRLVDGVYPFADDPFGNLICFDYRNEKANPSIVFWDHEAAYTDPGKAISPICGSFTELLSKLYSHKGG